MSTELQAVTIWLQSRPQWLQYAASLLWKNSALSNLELDTLTDMTVQEVEENLKIIQQNPLLPITPVGSSSDKLQLVSMSDIQGINNLSPRKPLEFNIDGTTIVYGDNGSGKSGYVRILKHLCGARDPGSLHENVFQQNKQQQKLTISFNDGSSKNKTQIFECNGSYAELEKVDIFDSQLGNFFLGRDAEVSYEPQILLFLTNLVDICAEISRRIDLKLSQLISKKPIFPIPLQNTEESIWYKHLSASSLQTDIVKFCSFSSENEQELANLQKRINEKSPAYKIKQCQIKSSHIQDIISTIQNYTNKFSDTNYKKFLEVKNDLESKVRAAKIAADKGFPHDQLKGVGEEVWKNLWEAARAYSTLHAYKGLEYPNVSENALCVLCQQPLNAEAQERFVSFETFVKEEIQKAAIQAKINYEEAREDFKNFITEEALDTKLAAAGIVQGELSTQLRDLFKKLELRKNNILEDVEIINSCPSATEILQELALYIESFSKNIQQYEEDLKTDNREVIQKQLDSLQAKKWLSENRNAIDDEIKRLKRCDIFNNAKKLTSTTALSAKKK